MMHRLRTRKKTAKDDAAAASSSSNGVFKRGKSAPAPNFRAPLDLSTALPATDDLRTSLLMPNLANRFSILKEQIEAENRAKEAAARGGPANGGTGAFDFNLGGSAGQDQYINRTSPYALPDISETSSLKEPGREPRDSHSSGGSGQVGDESIMNRSRGYEGNIMFGGRQKIYKVNTMASGPSSEGGEEGVKSGGGGGAMRGRVFYEDDLPASSFAGGPRARKFETDSYVSPLGPLDQEAGDRGTTYSTNSTPTTITRSSTAATSIHSTNISTAPTSAHNSSLTPISPTTSKPPRRLYEQALDQQLYEQQSKLEMLAQRRLNAASPIGLNYSMNQPSNNIIPPARPGAVSPTTRNEDTLSGFNFGIPPSPMEPKFSEQVRPASPVSSISPSDRVSVSQSVSPVEQPALSAFKPATRAPGGYDDSKYQEFIQKMKEQDAANSSIPASRVESRLDERQDMQSNRSRGESDASARTNTVRISELDLELEKVQQRAGRSSTFSSQPQSGTFLSADSGSEYDSDEEYMAAPPLKKPAPASLSLDNEIRPLSPQKKTDNKELTSPFEQPRKDSTTIGIGGMSFGSDYAASGHTLSPMASPKLRAISPASPVWEDGSKDNDSPTLPPGQGLSLMVRQHLRNISTASGRSSIYAASTYTTRQSRTFNRDSMPPPPNPNSQAANLASAYAAAVGEGSERPSVVSGSSGGNVWEFEDWDGVYEKEERTGSSLSNVVKAADLDTPSSRSSGEDRSRQGQQATEARAKKDDDDIIAQVERAWATSRNAALDEPSAPSQQQPQPSTQPTSPDQDWETELSQRKRMVTENLRTRESAEQLHSIPPKARGRPDGLMGSPMGLPQGMPQGMPQGFQHSGPGPMGHPAFKEEGGQRSAKAMKMLGITASPPNGQVNPDTNGPQRGPGRGSQPNSPPQNPRGRRADLSIQTGNWTGPGPAPGPQGFRAPPPNGMGSGPRGPPPGRGFPPEGPPHFNVHPAHRNGPPSRGPPPPQGQMPNGRPGPGMRGPPPPPQGPGMRNQYSMDNMRRAESPGPGMRGPGFRSESPGPGMRGPGFRSESPGPGMRGPGFRSESPGPGMRGPGFRSESPGPGMRGPGFRSESPGPGMRGPGFRPESPGPGPGMRNPGFRAASPGPNQRMFSPQSGRNERRFWAEDASQDALQGPGGMPRPPRAPGMQNGLPASPRSGPNTPTSRGPPGRGMPPQQQGQRNRNGSSPPRPTQRPDFDEEIAKHQKMEKERFGAFSSAASADGNRSRQNSNAVSPNPNVGGFDREREQAPKINVTTQITIATSPNPASPPRARGTKPTPSPLMLAPAGSGTPMLTPTSATSTTPSSFLPSTPLTATTTPTPTSASQHLAKLTANFVPSANPARKRVVDKKTIGLPTLVSSTSNVPTVELADYASHRKAQLDSPGEGKRRMTTSTSIFSSFSRSSDGGEGVKSPTRSSRDDEGKGRKLRKSTSDGGALNMRFRPEVGGPMPVSGGMI